jgi:hypothetical protein
MCADVRLESCGGSVQAKHIQAQNNVLVSFSLYLQLCRYLNLSISFVELSCKCKCFLSFMMGIPQVIPERSAGLR